MGFPGEPCLPSAQWDFCQKIGEARVEEVGHDQPSTDLTGSSQMEPERRLPCI